MKKVISHIIVSFMILCLVIGFTTPMVRAEETTDEAVAAVIAQLEAIDTLQQMQDKRSSYTASGRYDINTTDTAIIASHEKARADYEAYVAQMFAARIAAQQAYDALTPEQQAQIDPALVEKLSNNLPTVFHEGTFPVTPSDNEYTFETVNGGAGYGYEVSNYMVSGNIPQTFVLVDTSNGATSWKPNGLYEYGESNYHVAYCCDVQTKLNYGSHYKRVNLEDSGYYGANAAQHIRAILQNSYPFVTMDEMKANLKADGLDAEFVDSLSRSDMMSAVQMAIWTYANAEDGAKDGLGYFASVDITKNTGTYFTPLHDHTNEVWEWLPGKKQRSYDARAAYRVNTLAYYLCNLEGIPAEENQIVISNVEVTRAELLPGSDNTYQVGMYVYLNKQGNENDDLKITIESYHENEDGTITTTAQSNQAVAAGTKAIEMYVNAQQGDKIKVVVEGTQYLARGVYFYEPEGGRSASQCLVGVAEGQTKVRAEEKFVFVENTGGMGLRIYKTETGTGKPISDIIFTVYKVVGGTSGAAPTPEEIAKYAVESNKVASVITDVTGYASTALAKGTYLIVEEHNAEKVKAPVSPFYITVPLTQTTESEDGTTSTESVNIVSVYPKNEPVIPPEEPPVIPPPPSNATGSFQILKYDEADRNNVLAGAQFEVYRAATVSDTDTQIITCDGVQYAVVPVTVNGGILVLTTDANGRAASPELSCGTYFLLEVNAPDGYNLLDGAVSVTVVPKEITTTVVEIANQRGNILPETGGMGTTLFLVFGSLMLFAAGILLVTKRRMGSYE